ncbi:hypothetical protein SCHPADRAFT_894517 [Schizopora paradoxa]|uniref:Uncharacterized protein n=1 Tax=Schizopora paradoxa TaxID=27342 RepID=A0A0H2R893_9AGAM|nr:hypothetical protein SCHPADRAFT_894517 [Schizopora paradoxa]
MKFHENRWMNVAVPEMVPAKGVQLGDEESDNGTPVTKADQNQNQGVVRWDIDVVDEERGGDLTTRAQHVYVAWSKSLSDRTPLPADGDSDNGAFSSPAIEVDAPLPSNSRDNNDAFNSPALSLDVILPSLMHSDEDAICAAHVNADVSLSSERHGKHCEREATICSVKALRGDERTSRWGWLGVMVQADGGRSTAYREGRIVDARAEEVMARRGWTQGEGGRVGGQRKSLVLRSPAFETSRPRMRGLVDEKGGGFSTTTTTPPYSRAFDTSCQHLRMEGHRRARGTEAEGPRGMTAPLSRWREGGRMGGKEQSGMEEGNEGQPTTTITPFAPHPPCRLIALLAGILYVPVNVSMDGGWGGHCARRVKREEWIGWHNLENHLKWRSDAGLTTSTQQLLIESTRLMPSYNGSSNIFTMKTFRSSEEQDREFPYKIIAGKLGRDRQSVTFIQHPSRTSDRRGNPTDVYLGPKSQQPRLYIASDLEFHVTGGDNSGSSVFTAIAGYYDMVLLEKKDGDVTFFKHDTIHPNQFIDVTVGDIQAIRKIGQNFESNPMMK